MPKKLKQDEQIPVTPHKSPHTKPQSANVSPESVLPDVDWEKVLATEGSKDFYTTVMYKGKPLKVFVATEEVKIKKGKPEKVEPPVAQSSEKEESDLSQGSSAGQGEKKFIELMNKSTPEPSVSDTETSGSKSETKNESNAGRESENESDGKESDSKETDQESVTKIKEKDSGSESNGEDSDKGRNVKGEKEKKRK